MPIRVEFYGLARLRSGTSELTLVLPGGNASLADALQAIARRLPALGEELLAGGRLHPTLAANLDGQRFVSDPQTPIADGQCLLILSADAGG
jgi:molybdopterin converting factor small subunit